MYTYNIPTSATSASSPVLKCSHCGKSVLRGTYVGGNAYCSMCLSQIIKSSRFETQHAASNPCDGCSSNPKNDPYASGVCHCTLGAMQYR